MQDSAPPPPAAAAALAACAAEMVEQRAGHARLLAAVAALSRTGAVAETGHRSLGRLLEELLHVDAGEARRLIRQSALLVAPDPTLLTPGAEPPGPDLPATAQAADEGAVGPEHVAIVARTMHRLRRVLPALPPAVLAETESQLAELARDRTPGQTADAAHDVLLLLDPDGEGPHDADRPVEELRMTSGRDGSLSGRFRFAEPEAAEAIRSAIAARTPAPEPDADTTTLRPGRELHERRAEALRALVDDAGPAHDDAGAGPHETTDDGGASTGPTLRLVDEVDSPEVDSPEVDAPAGAADTGRPARDRPSRETTMLVTVSLETLTGASSGERTTREWQGGAPQGLGLLDGRFAVSGETARRLACDAAIVPVVLGGRGEILDLGRKTRVVSTAQRRAVVARDRHCAHPGCRRSPRRCDVHHVVPWFRDGPSDLANLVLLCPYHHHQVHHSGWVIEMRDGVPWFVPPAWLDPLRRARSNRTAEVAA